MKSFSIRQIKQRISDVVDASRDDPVALTRYRKPIAVVMSPQRYRELLALEQAAKARTLDHVVEALARDNAMGAGARRLLAALSRGAR